MNLVNITKEARENFDLSEDEMWKSIGLFSSLLEEVEDLDPQIALKNKIKFIEIVFKGHFPKDFAENIVAEMHSSDYLGKHWSIEQIKEVSKALDLSFSSATTEGDKLYAFNAFWHDIHSNGDEEEKIFKDAYIFFFNDEDYEGTSKAFSYFKGMNL